jgi:fido (protein-threonine AMPylation protein)
VWLFSNLLREHPFSDGNGRLCRILLAYVLFPIIGSYTPIINKNYEEYIHDVKCAENNNLTYDDFKNSLFGSTKTLISMNTIRSFNHQLMSCEQNKIGLSAYDDKRYILDNGYNTLPYGSVFI